VVKVRIRPIRIPRTTTVVARRLSTLYNARQSPIPNPHSILPCGPAASNAPPRPADRPVTPLPPIGPVRRQAASVFIIPIAHSLPALSFGYIERSGRTLRRSPTVPHFRSSCRSVFSCMNFCTGYCVCFTFALPASCRPRPRACPSLPGPTVRPECAPPPPLQSSPLGTAPPQGVRPARQDPCGECPPPLASPSHSCNVPPAGSPSGTWPSRPPLLNAVFLRLNYVPPLLGRHPHPRSLINCVCCRPPPPNHCLPPVVLQIAAQVCPVHASSASCIFVAIRL